MAYFKKFLPQVRNAPVPAEGATQFKNTMSTVLKTFGIESDQPAPQADVRTFLTFLTNSY